MGNKPNRRADASEDESESGMKETEKRFIIVQAYLETITQMVERATEELLKLKETLEQPQQTTLDVFYVMEAPSEALTSKETGSQTKNRPLIGQYQCGHCKDYGHNVRTCPLRKAIWWSE